MKKKFYSKQILKVSFFLSLLSISTYTFTYTSGPPGQYTNAPSEGNCTTCHPGSPVSSGTEWSAITLTGIPSSGYMPSNTYTVTLAGSSAATSKNGFQITALTSSNSAAGFFTSGTGSSAQTINSRNYVGHNSSGTSLTSFTFSWTAPSTTVGTITFYVSYNATNGDNSWSGDVVYVKTFSYSPGNLPTAVISPPTGTALCIGDTLFLQGSGVNNPLTYSWSFLGSLPGEPNTSSLQNPQIKYLTTGFKTIRLITSNSSGNSVQAQITINVVAKPVATITPSGPQVICSGDSITLTATSGTGLTYLWSPLNQTSKSIKVGVGGPFNVKVTNSSNCFSISPGVTTTAAAKPVITVTTSKDSSCVTDSVQITATAGQGYYKYYVNNVRVDSTISNSISRILNAGMNQISVISNNGSCNSNTVLKTVNTSTQDPAPLIICGVASSSTVTFTVSGNNAQISLDTGKTWLSPNNGASLLITGLNPNQQVSAQARLANTGVCSYTLISSRTCVANACQPVTFALNFSKRNCLKSNADTALVPLTVSNLNIPNYSVNFNNSGYVKTVAYLAKVSLGNNPVRIMLLDSSNLGCGVKDTTVTISGVNPIISSPLLRVTSTICSNGFLSLNVINTAGAGLFKYYKNNDSVPFASKTSIEGPNLVAVPLSAYNVQNHDVIKVVAIDLIDGCTKNSNAVVIDFVSPAVAGFSYIKENLKIVINSSGPDMKKYTWDLGDGTIITSGPKSSSHTYTKAGAYKVALGIIDTNGCMNSDTQTVNIVSSGIAQNLFTSGEMLAYPNPSFGALTVSWNKKLGTEGKLILFDIQGKIVFEKFVNVDENINISQLSKGAFFLKLFVSEEVGWQKLLIE